MHNAAFRALGLDWVYELLDVDAADLPAAVGGLRSVGVRGANVTVPHKPGVVALLDELDSEAARLGAVNTITADGGRLVGFNTDVTALRILFAGAFAALEAPVVVILGGGGAARAAIAALPQSSRVTVVARRRPSDLTARFMPWDSDGWAAACRRADVVINATPLGRGGERVLNSQDLPRAGVIDLVYADSATPLVAAALAAGLTVVDGWAVLLEQGCGSFRIWTGLEPPRAAMQAALAR